MVAPDHPRLLSIIAGACATSGASIVDGAFHRRSGCRAIFVSRAFDRDEDELRRANRIAVAIEEILAR